MALIDNVQDIKKHNSAISIQMELSGVQSFIDDGIDNHIIPAIGRTVFNELIAAKAALTEVQKPAFDFVQKSCVGFLLAYYSVSGAVQINSGGIYVVKGANTAPASDKKLMALRKDGFEKGYNALEFAVNYLEANKDSFPTYKNSDERKKNRSMFINSSAEFQESGVNIGNNAQLYQVLRTYQEDAERTYVNNLIGTELNILLRGLILNGGASGIQKQLIKEIQRPVASLTMLEAIPYLSLSIDATGIYQLSETVGGISGNVENRTAAEINRVQIAMYRLQQKGEGQLETLRKWITKHKDEFPEYTVPGVIDLNDDPNSNIYFL